MNRADRELVYITAALASVIAVGTLVFAWQEGWSLFDSFYFTLCLAFSVGFGDIVPSPGNRIMAAFFIMIASTLALILAANVGIWMLSNLQSRIAVSRFRGELSRLNRELHDTGLDTSDLEEDLAGILDETAENISSLEVKRPRFILRGNR